MKLEAPWTPEQVLALNDWQQRGDVHPFTCGNGSHDLVATVRGWICPMCDYTQNWAHDFMAACKFGFTMNGCQKDCPGCAGISDECWCATVAAPPAGEAAQSAPSDEGLRPVDEFFDELRAAQPEPEWEASQEYATQSARMAMDKRRAAQPAGDAGEILKAEILKGLQVARQHLAGASRRRIESFEAVGRAIAFIEARAPLTVSEARQQLIDLLTAGVQGMPTPYSEESTVRLHLTVLERIIAQLRGAP